MKIKISCFKKINYATIKHTIKHTAYSPLYSIFGRVQTGKYFSQYRSLIFFQREYFSSVCKVQRVSLKCFLKQLPQVLDLFPWWKYSIKISLRNKNSRLIYGTPNRNQIIKKLKDRIRVRNKILNIFFFFKSSHLLKPNWMCKVVECDYGGYIIFS